MAIDASAFYAGIPFLSGFSSFYATNEILEEVKHIKKDLSAIDVLIDSRSLTIAEPSEKIVESVIRTSVKTGDRVKLSSADISIIALAVEKNLALMTDDYSVANVAIMLGIKTVSSAGKGLIETRRWLNYCSGCSKSFRGSLSECPLCGNKLRRNYKRIQRK